MSVTAPGNAIISTVPVRGTAAAPYLAMDGTSMATPVTTAALAILLADNETYRQLDRDSNRAAFALGILAQNARSLGLGVKYQGAGLARQVAQLL